jgi:hypothetical protein
MKFYSRGRRVLLKILKDYYLKDDRKKPTQEENKNSSKE